MSCACKVSRDLTYLQKKYGTNPPKSKSFHLNVNFYSVLKILFFSIILCLCMPFMILHVLLNRNKKIDIAKLFRLKNKENVRSKQNI